jgi:hypothetical protein
MVITGEVRILAIYHYSMQVISRSDGQRNAVACAAYRSGEKLMDESTDQQKYYPRDVQPDSFIMAPSNAPEWMVDRQKLWSEVEKVERRKDSQLAREMNIALPVELSDDQQKALVRTFAEENFVDHGMVADIAIHRDDPNNPHFHVMLTTRYISEEGFGKKAREWNPGFKNAKGNSKGFIAEKNTILNAREQWAKYANIALEQAGVKGRISHLRLDDGSLKLIPTQHLGPQRHAMEEKGVATEVGEKNREIQKHNAAVVSFHEQKRKLEEEKVQQKEFDSLAPDEKVAVKAAEKMINKKVDYEVCKDRLSQINNWETRVKRKLQDDPSNQRLLNQIGKIKEQRQTFTEAKADFENEAIQELQKLYTTEEIEGLSREECCYIYSYNQTHGNVRPENFKYALEVYHDDQTIQNAQRYMKSVTYDQLQTEIGKLQNWGRTIDRKKIDLGAGMERAVDPETYQKEHADEFKKLFKQEDSYHKKKAVIEKADEVVQKRVTLQLVQQYPDYLYAADIPVKQAKYILDYNKYYNQVIPLEDIENIPIMPRFTKNQRQDIYTKLNILKSIDRTTQKLNEGSTERKHSAGALKAKRAEIKEQLYGEYQFDYNDQAIKGLFIKECQYQKDSFLKEKEERELNTLPGRSAGGDLVNEIAFAIEQAEREEERRTEERLSDAKRKRRRNRGLSR